MILRLAELHEGAAMARSDVGKGSTFTVWLPWRMEAILNIEMPVVPCQQDASVREVDLLHLKAGSNALVLVVEDDPQTAKILRLQMENEGYRVIHASNAETGLRLAEEKQPCAIVLDIMLPGMDGWQMLTKIKQTKSIADIPVVIVSITDDASRGFALGASQVLTKPITQDELMSALSSLGFTPAQHANVLVADDDPKAVSLISLHLNAAGFTPIGAYGGREAIEIAMDKKPALIVLDLMMPEVSGFDVMQALHRNPATVNIPIIVLTAKILTQEDRERLNGKVQRIIEKSRFDPAILYGEVKRALARSAGKPVMTSTNEN
jgi:DNA-binding response OmpR family regulator